MAKQPAVYILASRRNGPLYAEATRDLVGRVWEHRNDHAQGFAKRYGVHRLAYFVRHDGTTVATLREKRVKGWNRSWKIGLIEEADPAKRDLWPTIVGDVEMHPRFRGNDGKEEAGMRRSEGMGRHDGG